MNKRTGWMGALVALSLINGLIIGGLVGMRYQAYRMSAKPADPYEISRNLSFNMVHPAITSGPLDGKSPVAIFACTNGSSQNVWVPNLGLTVCAAFGGEASIWVKIRGQEQPRRFFSSACTIGLSAPIRLGPGESLPFEVYIENGKPNGSGNIASPIVLAYIEYYADNGQYGAFCPGITSSNWQLP